MKENCNCQKIKEDLEVRKTVEQCISAFDPDIFNNVDGQNQSSFTEHNSSSLVSLEPETANASKAEKLWLISQATRQWKWVKHKTLNKQQKNAEAPS